MHSQSRLSSRRDNIMANTVLGMTVLALLAGCVAGAGIPSTGYAFSYYNPDGGKISQSRSGASDTQVYHWSYQYPGQQHNEKKTPDGQVNGDYAFRDANGVEQKINYQAAPGVGFKVKQTETARSGGLSATKSDVSLDPAVAAANPWFVAKFRSGQVQLFKQEDNDQVFIEDPSLAAVTKGSFSLLAELLNLDTHAPRHDQQVRSHPNTPYSSRSEGASRDVIELVGESEGRLLFRIQSFPRF